MSKCCVTGFQWSGTPKGTESQLANNQAYVTGSNPRVALLYVHDLFGWKFPNARLLADHFAAEIDATVYIPDFFGGRVLDFDTIAEERYEELDLPNFFQVNSREAREPELFECARALRKEYAYVGAVGYCFGGWACLKLSAESSKTEDGKPLVDAIAFGHPTMITTADFEENRAPTLVLAPEHDPIAYFAEQKQLTFEAFQRNGVEFSYMHFPGLHHGFCTRGSTKAPGERKGMVRAKNATVGWFRQYLSEDVEA